MRGLFVALAFCIAGSALAAGGTLVPIASLRTFAPMGFDDNDQIQVVIEGKLDNDCFRLDKPTIKVDDINHQIQAQPMAAYFQWMCLEVQVPWTQVIDIGRLSAGDWIIKTGGRSDSDTVSETISVKASSTLSPDDHVYAPIESLNVDVQDGITTATLRGHFSTRCAEFEDIKVIDSGKTIEILPIMRSGIAQNCEPSETPFERQVQLPHKAAGRYLVHARSLNGQALNQVYEAN